MNAAAPTDCPHCGLTFELGSKGYKAFARKKAREKHVAACVKKAPAQRTKTRWSLETTRERNKRRGAAFTRMEFEDQ